MDETRKARHDQRQHLAVVKSIWSMTTGGACGIHRTVSKPAAPRHLERYCRNDVVNAVVCYYAASARDGGIAFEVGIDYRTAASWCPART